MKVIDKKIYPFQEDIFFSPIRKKTDYLRLIVLSARHLLLNLEIDEKNCSSNIKLIIDKMSRLFFYKERKYFSVAFPLTTEIHKDKITKITTHSGKELNNESISSVISILDSAEFQLNSSLLDFYIEPNSNDSLGIFLLEELILFEPSYIRFDHDPDNQKGKFHPINHIDINYSQYSTFKIGLKDVITTEYFESLQNTKTECSFLSL
jgi:hypothetical protein